MRIEPAKLDEAWARARLATRLDALRSGLGSGRATPARLGARRAARHRADLDAGAATPAQIRFALDPEAAEPLFQHAAAARHGHAIAEQVTAAERARIEAALGPERHAFAILHRAAATPEPYLGVDALIAAIAADEAACRALWIADLPAGLRPALPDALAALGADAAALPDREADRLRRALAFAVTELWHDVAR